MISQHNCKWQLLQRMGIQKIKWWIDDEWRAADDDDRFGPVFHVRISVPYVSSTVNFFSVPGREVRYRSCPRPFAERWCWDAWDLRSRSTIESLCRRNARAQAFTVLVRTITLCTLRTIDTSSSRIPCIRSHSSLLSSAVVSMRVFVVRGSRL
jgi:hypothetical protein